MFYCFLLPRGSLCRRWMRGSVREALERLAGAWAPHAAKCSRSCARSVGRAAYAATPSAGRAEGRAQLPQDVQLQPPPPYQDMYDKPKFEGFRTLV